MQIYCKDLDKYLDLGGDTNFSFNLENQWQHFFEEPQDYTFSTSIPNTENNLEIVRSGKFLSVIVDNYVVMDRFLCNLISTDLAQMEISLYRTRINKSFDLAESGVKFGSFFLNYESRLKNVCRQSVLCRAVNSGSGNNAEFSTLYPYSNPLTTVGAGVSERLVRWTDTDSGEFYGNGSLTWLAESDIKVAEACVLNVPLKDMLNIMLGYVPKEYEDDQTAVRLPFDWTKIKLTGKIRVHLLWGFRPVDIEYKPKYLDRWITMTYTTDYMQHFWEHTFWKKWRFAIEQDNIQYNSDYFKDKNNPYNVTNTDTPILPLAKGISADKWFGGITNIGQDMSPTNYFNVEFEVDEEVDFTKDGWGDVPLYPSYIINSYWEDLAKQLPLICDYEKGVDTLFHNAIFYPNNAIIDYKEQNTLNNDKQITAFKFPFGGLNPYWHNLSKEYPIDLKQLTIGDLYITAENTLVNGTFPFLVTKYGDKLERRVNRAKYTKSSQGWMSFKPISINTHLYCTNYQQNVLNTVKLTCINYEFQTDVIIGSRHFVVDKVQTDDFKIYKLTLIEYPVE